MPLGSEHVKDGLLVREGAGLVLKRDAGGGWRQSLRSHDEMLLSRRVKVHAARSDYDLLDVKWIVLADWELWAIGGTLIARHGEDATLFAARRSGALALNSDRSGLAPWKEVACRVTILSAGSARQLDA